MNQKRKSFVLEKSFSYFENKKSDPNEKLGIIGQDQFISYLEHIKKLTPDL